MPSVTDIDYMEYLHVLLTIRIRLLAFLLFKLPKYVYKHLGQALKLKMAVCLQNINLIIRISIQCLGNSDISSAFASWLKGV